MKRTQSHPPGARTLKPPSGIDTLFMQGFSLHQKGRLDEAAAIYTQVVEKEPRHFDALHLLGVIAGGTRNPSKAVDWISKAIHVNPGVAAAHSNLGAALKELGRLDEAVASYDRAIRLAPDMAEVHSNRGNTLREKNRLEEAVTSFDRAIAIKPDYADAHSNRGNALLDLKRFDEALASYERGLELKPDMVQAWSNRGLVLQKLKRLDDAVESYVRAIRLKPDFCDAYVNLGNAFKDLNRLTEALAVYELAIQVRPHQAKNWFNRAVVLSELNRLSESLSSYDRAIELDPCYSDAFANSGHVLQQLTRFEEALTRYERAAALRPAYEFLLGASIHVRLRMCDWSNYDKRSQQLAHAQWESAAVSPPFIVATTLDVPALQRISAEVWAASRCPAQDTLGPIVRATRRDRIRIGYFSADFHDHATCYLMAELFESHAKDKFELFAFSFGPDVNDAMRQRVAGAFDHFIDIRYVTDEQVACLSRELGIDIAIDLKGYTQESRPGIFSYRCAPVQVSYLGYPGTMGVPYMDYLIADEILIPPEGQGHYAEKIAYLPHSYQVNDTKRVISERIFTRAELGLPQEGFVFCCFNNSYKITPYTFDGWMRILKAVPGSVLWLLEDNSYATRNLKKEAIARGVDPERLVFGERLTLADHLARHRLADLFLDTLPCNAHTTASDSLWAGLPVLTLIGQSFAARVAASLLSAMDLPELIAMTQDDYEQLAIELASNPYKLGAIKAKLESNRTIAPLYNPALFTHHLESAYVLMYERHLAGLPPDHLFVSREAS